MIINPRAQKGRNQNCGPSRSNNKQDELAHIRRLLLFKKIAKWPLQQTTKPPADRLMLRSYDICDQITKI